MTITKAINMVHGQQFRSDAFSGVPKQPTEIGGKRMIRVAIAFIAGLVIGGGVGLVVAALLFAAREEDKK